MKDVNDFELKGELVRLTCNQFPTTGSAIGPGGSFNLGALSFMMTMPTNTATHNPCTTFWKVNIGASFATSMVNASIAAAGLHQLPSS